MNDIANLPPQSTPIKHGPSTVNPFTTNHKYRDKEVQSMGNEMRGYITGPMPPAEFLEEFFPPSSIGTTRKKSAIFKPQCFKDVVTCTGEKEAYKPFVSQ